MAAIWQEIVRFMMSNEIKQYRVAEVFQIFHKLKNSGCFLYSAVPATIEGLTSSKVAG